MKIAVIGGGGKMGQWLCRHLVDAGHEVVVADRDNDSLDEVCRSCGVEVARSNIEAVNKAETIIISVPINAFEPVVKEIAPYIHLDQVVLDITSIKARPVTIMHENIKKGLILGTHPLFGSDVIRLEGQNFVLTPTDEKEKDLAEKIEKYLKERGASVKMMSPEEHDRMMAVVQGLSHFVAIIAADALSGLGPLNEMKEVSTTTFRVFLDYIKTVIGDDPELYAAIQMEHPEMKDIYHTLSESLEKWAGLVDRNDTQEFVEGMMELKGYIRK
jgi:prephenate dehydrogenase